MKNDYAELIEGCKRKKNYYYKILYNRFSPVLYAICIRYLKNRDEALDCLQDGFIEIYNCIENYRGEGSFEGWIKRLQVNVCLMYLREKRKIQYEKLTDDFLNKQYEDFEISTQLSIQTVLKAINCLPYGYKTIFNLYVIKGYSHKQISKSLRISEGTSKSQLARAKKLLRKELDSKLEE